jgi:hypothetical protein
VELVEHLQSLRELERPSLLSTAVAVATVKRYLAESQHRIRLHDLVHEETETVYQELLSERFTTSANVVSKEDFQHRMGEYEVLLERLTAMIAAIGYHGTGEDARLMTRCVERPARPPRPDGNTALTSLQYYPALLVNYAGGISALASNRFHGLSATLREPECRDHRGREKIPALDLLNVWDVFDNQSYKWVPRPKAEREFTPANNYLCDLLRPILKDYLPDELEYQDAFDVFEYILGLEYLELVKQTWAPLGRFAWRWRDEWQRSPMFRFINDGLRQGDEWLLLKAGFFGGSISRFQVFEDLYKTFLAQAKRWL